MAIKLYIPFMQKRPQRLQLLTKYMGITLFSCLILLIGSCQSSDGDFNLFSLEDDKMMGETIHEMLMEDAGSKMLNASEHKELYNILDDLKYNILSSEKLYHSHDLDWQLSIIHNDSIVNAFSTPGGYLYFYTGLLIQIESLDELAGIMAHEIAHADRRHGAEQLSKQYGLRVVFGFFFGDAASFITDVGTGLLGLTFSRSNEREADEMAVMYLNETDYHPLGFASFFERLSNEDQFPEYMEFLSTHPDPGNRKQNIENRWKTSGGHTGKDHEHTFRRLKQLLVNL